ncbi:MAG: helix-turn-helix domain-containing protein [Candidatus Saccharimonadales bacterium]
MSNVTTPIESTTGCVATALEVLGNKWTALIIRDLAAGCQRFCGLERSLAGISPRTLSQRLDDLEKFGIVTRKTYAEVPPRTEYSLTQKGQDLLPILRQMADWGEKYPAGHTPVYSIS